VEEDAESDSGGGKNIEGSTAGGRKRGGVGADEPDSKK